MKARRVAACILLITALAFGQTHKPAIDPETKEGYVIQLIQQERDASQKVKMMLDFVQEFPKSGNLSWVYDLLQPVYLKSGEWDKALDLGSKMLALDANDLYAAHGALQAAEALKDPDQVVQYATTSWQIGSRLVATPKYAEVEYAKQVMAYAEYAIAAVANAETDRKKNLAYMASLEAVNPKSLWLNKSAGDFNNMAQGLPKDKLVQLASRMVANDPANEDMLMVIADFHMGKGDAPDLVLDYATRVLEIMRTKARPAAISEEDWQRKKDNYLSAAHYMSGVVSSMQGRFAQADRDLRAALPALKNANGQVLGAVLYHLGYANYQLAENGERPRVFDAIKFNEQCAGVASSYREQAQKNVQSIKSEYNLR